MATAKMRSLYYYPSQIISHSISHPRRIICHLIHGPPPLYHHPSPFLYEYAVIFAQALTNFLLFIRSDLPSLLAIAAAMFLYKIC